jgi:hypothetical protein
MKRRDLILVIVGKSIHTSHRKLEPLTLQWKTAGWQLLLCTSSSAFGPSFLSNLRFQPLHLLLPSQRRYQISHQSQHFRLCLYYSIYFFYSLPCPFNSPIRKLRQGYLHLKEH